MGQVISYATPVRKRFCKFALAALVVSLVEPLTSCGASAALFLVPHPALTLLVLAVVVLFSGPASFWALLGWCVSKIPRGSCVARDWRSRGRDYPAAWPPAMVGPLVLFIKNVPMGP